MNDKTKAQEKFNEEVQIMKNLLTKIKYEVEAMEKQDIKGNWGYVGSAKQITKQLKEVLDFVG